MSHHESSRVKTHTRLALALALALAALLASPAARACGMDTFYRERPRAAPALLADAQRAVEQGRRVRAVVWAHAVIDHRRATPALRARAWAVIGWVRWQEGQKQEALDALARSRSLDRAAVDFILAHASDNRAAAALKTALEG
jgi:hypothetical protein